MAGQWKVNGRSWRREEQQPEDARGKEVSRYVGSHGRSWEGQWKVVEGR